MTPKNLIYRSNDYTGFNENLSDTEYHSMKEYVGSTSLREILKSPKAFYYNYFIKKPEPEKEHFRIGKVIHSALLEPERFRNNYVVMPDFGDQRAKANKQAKLDWLEENKNKIHVKENELEQIELTVQNIIEHEDTKKYFTNEGKRESSFFFADKETQIKCKVRPDYFDEKYLIDVKTTRDASTIGFGSSAFNFRYDIQLAYYAWGLSHFTSEIPKVVILAIGNQAPFECAYYEVLPIHLERGLETVRQALSTLRISIDEDFWPQRQRNTEQLYCPQWFVNKETIEMENENE